MVSTSKRFQTLDERPINQDTFSAEWPEKGLAAMTSPYDPPAEIQIENGIVTRLDGKARSEFDTIDQFIADYSIDVEAAKTSMNLSSLEIARKLVDIHISRDSVIKIFSGLSPAKIVEVMNHLNVVEMMMALQKMRARRMPSNQAHITNLFDHPVQIAADAAECSLRGFREEETTTSVARYAPFNAIALLIGAQTGRPGVLTQCAVEEAVELDLGMRGFTTYAETISVYGTEQVFVDGDDSPYSKAFLAAAYASRGLKMRFTSGTGSEVLMGNAEQKSMLYLETRCILLTKGSGVQGLQNGSVSCIGVVSAVPSGIRAILAENLIAACLDLEVASSNDQTFSHSDMRRTARTMMQFLPGTDFIFSGYSGTPNYDNVFAGSNFDAEDFDDYNVLQRDLMVDGGLKSVSEEEVIRVRHRAGKAIQAVFRALKLSEITDEEVDLASISHGSKDMNRRRVSEDLSAIEDLNRRGICGIDIVKALAETGYEDIAQNVLSMLKHRLYGDYLQTSAIINEKMQVESALNQANDYQGPGSGYRVSGKRWEEICAIRQVIDPRSI